MTTQASRPTDRCRATPNASRRAVRARRWSLNTCPSRSGRHAGRVIRWSSPAMRSSPSSCSSRSSAGRLFVRQAHARGAGTARPREDRQHSARPRPARHRRSARARERHRAAVGVHPGVVVLKAKDDLKYGEYKFTKQMTLRETIETIIEGKVIQHAITIPEGLTSEQIIARLAEIDFLAGNIREDPERRHAAARDLQFPARHDARAGDPAHAAGASPRAAGGLGAAQPRSAGRRRRRRWSRSPRSSRRKPVGPTSARASPRCSPTGFARSMKLQSDPTIIYGLVGGKGRSAGRSCAPRSSSRRHTTPT